MIRMHPGFWTQIISIVISSTCVVGYYIGYRLGMVRVMKVEKTHENLKIGIPLLFNYMGVLHLLIWLIMPFLKQPRFPGFIEVIQGGSVSIIGLITSIFGLCITISFFMWGILSTKINLKVTKNNYFAPEKLLTHGMYGLVRNPLTIGGFFFELGLCLCTGAYYTSILLPVYFVLNDLNTWIEEKYSLKPKFSEELDEYKKTTPKYFTWWLMLLLILGITAVIVNFAWVEIVI